MSREPDHPCDYGDMFSHYDIHGYGYGQLSRCDSSLYTSIRFVIPGRHDYSDLHGDRCVKQSSKLHVYCDGQRCGEPGRGMPCEPDHPSDYGVMFSHDDLHSHGHGQLPGCKHTNLCASVRFVIPGRHVYGYLHGD